MRINFRIAIWESGDFALHCDVREDLPAVVGNVGSECILVHFSSNLPVPG